MTVLPDARIGSSDPRQARVVERRELGLKGVDLLHERAGATHPAVVRSAEDLLRNRAKSKHLNAFPRNRTACPATRRRPALPVMFVTTGALVP